MGKFMFGITVVRLSCLRLNHFAKVLSECFFDKYGGQVHSANDIKGLGDLRWDDQKSIKDRFSADDEDGRKALCCVLLWYLRACESDTHL